MLFCSGFDLCNTEKQIWVFFRLGDGDDVLEDDFLVMEKLVNVGLLLRKMQICLIMEMVMEMMSWKLILGDGEVGYCWSLAKEDADLFVNGDVMLANIIANSFMVAKRKEKEMVVNREGGNVVAI
ncbi:hypothetical protein L6452_40651 [Arctium lappa]|uniref:Uncharacterized protein n=1 Tax=Arctium lappa TaxID=4217 RepID=A0ACB8XMH5_ARCLA|nr:hypothetical protein L6452_40651 [Arctium lappa]